MDPGRANPVDSTVADRKTRAHQVFQQALGYERDHHPGAAIVSYRTALRLDPTIRDANYRMGLLFNTRSQWAESRKCFAAELELHPDHADAARELALSMARTGDAPEAVTRLLVLSKKSPRDGRIWHALGFAYTQMGKPKE